MVTAIRYYLVDSENVNDNWLMLFDMIDETDEIIFHPPRIGFSESGDVKVADVIGKDDKRMI